MKNVVKTEFKIDKEKRTVVCIITTVDDLFSKITKYGCYDSNGEWFEKKRYIGKAKCAAGDQWDEAYGKKLAEYRASEKRKKDINRKIKKYVNAERKKLENLEKYGMLKDSRYPEYKGE